MKKQVLNTSAATVTAVEDSIDGNSQRNLYISVKTFDVEGRTIGERIVDMYHFGTRNWLQNHLWWAMHNTAQVETTRATDDEIGAYMASGKAALAEKFNKTTPAANTDAPTVEEKAVA